MMEPNKVSYILENGAFVYVSSVYIYMIILKNYDQPSASDSTLKTEKNSQS